MGENGANHSLLHGARDVQIAFADFSYFRKGREKEEKEGRAQLIRI